MADTVNVELKEVEVTKLNLQPGEVLVIQLKGEDFDSEHVLDSLKNNFSKIFPQNKVMVCFMGENHSIDFSVLSQDKKEESNEPNS